MHQETEVHFCNICNTSIPDAAIRDGKAVKVDGRVIPTAGPGSPAEPVAVGRGALLGVGALLCAAIAGAAVFLDWRLSDESQRLRGEVDASAPQLNRLGDRLSSLEARMSEVARANQFSGVEAGLRDVNSVLRETGTRSEAGLAEGTRQRDEMREQMRRLADAQVQHAARLALLQDDIRTLGRDVAELRASPSAAVRTPIDDGGHGVPTPVDGTSPMPAVGELPAALQHQIDRLADTDESVRFEAVQELLSAHDDRVLGKLVPIAKDSDFFVRRLVLEGLAEHRSAEHVELMLTALADPESLVRHSAYQGLKKLTGQSMPFDADASSEQRAAMQRRWRTWWDKAKSDF